MGCHCLPNVLGRRYKVSRAQRHCHLCDMHALGDERHLVFECPGMQGIRDRYPSLFAVTTMQHFMWQDDIVGVALFVRDCFDLINAPDDDEDALSNQP